MLTHRGLIPAVLAGNALGLLAFRHFVSLDGPMHLLHAAVLRDALAGKVRTAEGMWVVANTLDVNLGDLLLIGLSGMVHPFLLHKLLAVLSVTVVAVGAWRLARAYGTGINPLWLLVLPFAFGFVLVLGFFHFILASGLAFMICGWWVSRPSVRWHGLLLLAGGCALGTFAHTAGGALVLLFVGVHEAVERIRDPAGWRDRWSTVPQWLPTVVATIAVVLVSAMLVMRFSASPVHAHEAHHPWEELLTLRPTLLLDRAGELPFRIALGSALVGGMILALWGRRGTARLMPGDALLVSAVLLLLASLVRTPKTELLYITDRAQWLALLLMACWMGTQPSARGMGWAVACGVLSLHALRLVQLERRMHLLQDRDTSSLSAAQRFEAGALVVPVVLDTDWLARHRTAYAALGHNGIVFTGRDHLRFDWTTPPDIYVRKYIYSPENDWAWIGDHIRKGGLPELRQVMVLGAPSSGSAAWPELEQTLRERYHPVWHDDYTQVWTLDTE